MEQTNSKKYKPIYQQNSFRNVLSWPRWLANLLTDNEWFDFIQKVEIQKNFRGVFIQEQIFATAEPRNPRLLTLTSLELYLNRNNPILSQEVMGGEV